MKAHKSDCGYTVTGHIHNCSCEAVPEEDLLTKNMEYASVIRALRANAREDAKRIEELERERDEARDVVKILCDEKPERPIYFQPDIDEWMERHALAVQECEKLRRELDAAIRERDEAREKIERQAERIRKLEGATNHAGGFPDFVAMANITSAAQAVVDRWELPSWKDAEPTAAVIYRLRDALQEDSK